MLPTRIAEQGCIAAVSRVVVKQGCRCFAGHVFHMLRWTSAHRQYLRTCCDMKLCVAVEFSGALSHACTCNTLQSVPHIHYCSALLQ